MKTYAIRIHEHGGPEVLRRDELELTEPCPGQVRLAHRAVGLNYIDTYHRTGLYPVATLPVVLGSEAAGVVEAVGEGVTDLAPGDRVAYFLPGGAYAGHRLAPADRLVPIPEGISDETAAAVLLKGLTAWYLLRRTFVVEAGHSVLVHAAAGGVGSLLSGWARALGARVIGTAGSPEKADLARELGCHEVILYEEEDVAHRVRELTEDQGVEVVYDGVGKATFEASLDSLKPRGMMVSYGNASGPVPPVDLLGLSRRGSLYVTRPTLFTYVEERSELLAGARELFAAVRDGHVNVRIGQRYPLAEVARAHRDLEARQTTGSTVLIP